LINNSKMAESKNQRSGTRSARPKGERRSRTRKKSPTPTQETSTSEDSLGQSPAARIAARLTAALEVGVDVTSQARLVRAMARHRGLSTRQVESSPGVVTWPEWTRPARDRLMTAIIRSAFSHADLKTEETTAAATELENGDPELFVAILALFNDWVGWAFLATLHATEASYQREYPLLSRLYRPVSEVFKLWGVDAQKAIVELRLTFMDRAGQGQLPNTLDPDWIERSQLVGRTVASKITHAKGDTDETNTLLRLFRLRKKVGRGPMANIDRHLFYRILYVRHMLDFGSERQFFSALRDRLSQLPPPLIQRPSDLASWQKDIANKAFKSAVAPLLRCRASISGTALYSILARVSPERLVLARTPGKGD